MKHLAEINLNNIEGLIRKKMIEIMLIMTNVFSHDLQLRRRRKTVCHLYSPPLPPPRFKLSTRICTNRDCPAAYVGEGGRAFFVKIRDHASAFESKTPTKSIFSKHLIVKDHHSDEENVLHIERNYKRRLALECIESKRLLILRYLFEILGKIICLRVVDAYYLYTAVNFADDEV